VHVVKAWKEMTLTNATFTIESMPNEDNNEFMFSTNRLIKSQEACKICMEATSHFLVYNFWKIVTCHIAFIWC
jgi:hypothetical protein